MAPSLPYPVRIAAGLIGTTIDRIGALPKELPATGVRLAGQALRLTLKARQEIVTLAARGDELLARFDKPEEQPAWATFDEDEPDSDDGDHTAAAAADIRNGHPPKGSGAGVGRTSPGEDSGGPRPRDGAGGHDTVTPTVAGETAEASERVDRRGPVVASRPVAPAEDPDLVGVPEASDDPDLTSGPVDAPAPTPAVRTAATSSQRARSTPRPKKTPARAGAAGEPVPDLDQLSVSALKARLSSLTLPQVLDVLARERSGSARAAQLTLLENRVSTLEQQRR